MFSARGVKPFANCATLVRRPSKIHAVLRIGSHFFKSVFGIYRNEWYTNPTMECGRLEKTSPAFSRISTAASIVPRTHVSLVRVSMYLKISLTNIHLLPCEECRQRTCNIDGQTISFCGARGSYHIDRSMTWTCSNDLRSACWHDLDLEDQEVVFRTRISFDDFWIDERTE